MSLINTLKLVVKPLRVLIDNNSRRIDNNSRRIDNIVPKSDDILDILIELNACPAVTDAEGAILTDENGSILMTR